MTENLIAFLPSLSPLPTAANLPASYLPATHPPVLGSVEATTGVTQSVSVQPVPSRADLATTEAEWAWSELRDYVVAQIVQRFGPFPRDAKKEYGIFHRFLTAYGQDGIEVAKAAFEVYDGWWNNAPISINRFTKGSDEYFVRPILERLRTT